MTSALTAILQVPMRPRSMSTGTAAAIPGGGTAGATLACPRHKEIIAFPVYDCLADFALTNIASLSDGSIGDHVIYRLVGVTSKFSQSKNF